MVIHDYNFKYLLIKIDYEGLFIDYATYIRKEGFCLGLMQEHEEEKSNYVIYDCPLNALGYLKKF